METDRMIKLTNGQTVSLSLNLRELKNLKLSDSELFEVTNKVIFKGPDDVVEIGSLIYAAYLMVPSNHQGKPYTFDEFLELLPDLGIIKFLEIGNSLIMPKKK